MINHRISLILLTLLVHLSLAQYSLRFAGSTEPQLQYRYEPPVVYGDIEISFTLSTPPISDFVNALTIETTGRSTGKYDFITIEVTSSNVLVTVVTPKSGGPNEATTFCVNSIPADFTTGDTDVVVVKSGPVISLRIGGIEDPSSYFCQDEGIGEKETGNIPDISTVIIGNNFKGCLSQLKIGDLDFIPATDCGYPVDMVQKSSVTYVEGTCSDGNTVAAVCPTTPVPNPPKPDPVVTEPKKEPTEPKKEPTEPKKEPTEPKKEVIEPTKKPTEPKKEVTEPKKEVTEPKKDVTEPKKEVTEPKKDPKPKSEPKIPVIPPTEPSEEKPSPDKTKPEDDKEENETEEDNYGNDSEYEIENETDSDATIEAAKGDNKKTENNNNPLMIIIGVVAAGVILVVVLLYVGYKFHFRDKGSYKLEDGKGDDKDDLANANEYAELNPSPKDQEWYL